MVRWISHLWIRQRRNRQRLNSERAELDAAYRIGLRCYLSRIGYLQKQITSRERERERERGRGWVLVFWRVWYTQPVSENASALTSIVRYGVQGNPLYIYACIIEAKKWNEEELWMHLSKHERDNEIGWMLIIFYYVWYPSSIRYILRYLTRQLAMRYRLLYVPQTTWENL